MLVLPHKSSYPVVDIYYGQTYGLKTGVDKLMSMNVSTVKYGTLA